MLGLHAYFGIQIMPVSIDGIVYNGPGDAAWAASKAAASPIERESSVAGQPGRGSLAAPRPGPHAPM